MAPATSSYRRAATYSVDIRVEPPVCGFSLREFASQSPAAILLRAPSGIVLGRDPWGAETQEHRSELRRRTLNSPMRTAFELEERTIRRNCYVSARCD
jgi:hypothetical protein